MHIITISNDAKGSRHTINQTSWNCDNTAKCKVTSKPAQTKKTSIMFYYR